MDRPASRAGKPDDRIRVMCVDDHRIVREGIALIIGREPDMVVVGAAATGEEAIALFKERRPDITLMDLQLGSMSGAEAIRAIRREDPRARVVVLTMSSGDEDVYRALDAGAATYLLKDTALEDLVRVVREVQVLELVRKGLRNREVAASFGISEETVQTHVKNILAKLDVPDRTAAIDVALRRGIIHAR